MATTVKHLTNGNTIGAVKTTPLPNDTTAVIVYQAPSNTTAQISKIDCAGWTTLGSLTNGCVFEVHYVTAADSAGFSGLPVDLDDFRTLVKLFSVPMMNPAPLTAADVALCNVDLSSLVGMVLEAGSFLYLRARTSSGASKHQGGMGVFGVEIA